MPTLEVHPDRAHLIAAVRDRFVQAAKTAVEARGLFSFVFSGGSTPAALYRELAKPDSGVPWDKALLFFGDERNVGPAHPDSNYRMVHETLLGPASIDSGQVFRIESERGPELAARHYERTIRTALDLGVVDPPRFDIVLLGIGDDAHTASLFPGTAGLKVRDRLVVAHRIPKLDADRISLTYPAINTARAVWFLVTGEPKAAAVHRILESDDPIDDAPARGIDAESVTWWLDQPAASELGTR